MPCFRPIEVTIRRKKVYGVTPSSQQVVPCGSCVGCRAEQARQWGVRMMHEERMHGSSVFVTLTYRKEKLPDNGSLCPEDFQRFIKRLRKAQAWKISFFGCGEYGGGKERPHYHALLFGPEFLDRRFGAFADRPLAWHSKSLDDLWGMGITEGGSVTMASASYVAGYITKKVRARHFVRANRITGELLEPEFARMSLRPAIGMRWIQKHWRDVYPRDFVAVEGFEAKPPRYYDKWMDREDDKGGTAERRRVMDRVRTRRYDEAIQMTKYQLQAGEKIRKARKDLFYARDTV